MARSLRVNLFAAAALSGSCNARRAASAAALGRGLVGQLRHAARSVRGRVSLALGRDIVGRQGRAARSLACGVQGARSRGLVGLQRGAARGVGGRVGLTHGVGLVGLLRRAARGVRGRVGLALGRGFVGRLRGAARCASGRITGALSICFGGRLLLAPLLLTQPVALAPRVSKAVLARRARTGAGGGERGGAAASVDGCSNECEAHEDQQPGHFGVNDGRTDGQFKVSSPPLRLPLSP